MNIKNAIIAAIIVTGIKSDLFNPTVYAQIYTENFDVNDAANWTVNNNNQGVNAANFSFDYSTLGIPAAPNSGGSTIGLKLSSNISGTGPSSGDLPGISVSPTGLNLTGTYTITFDWWQNWLGGTTGGIGNSAGGSGSTQLSTFGLLTSGTTANYAGKADGVFFAATGDGASASDYRAYSVAAQSGYAVGNANNTYAAGSQNSSASYYTTHFTGGHTAGSIQTGISSTQTGSTLAGTMGFAWHQVTINNTGTNITWSVDGILMDTVNTAGITNAMGGGNILFGMADTSLGAGTPANLFSQLDFTLIDDIKVYAAPEPGVSALAALGVTGLFLIRRRLKA